jgi:AraC-like DNA-binding protein
VVDPPFPVEVFTNIHDAAAWLGDGTAGNWTTALAELWKRVLSDRPEVRQVRALISEDLVHATLDGAARALGVSPRTLQRQLQDAGTSFVSELTAARIAAAQAKMRSTDLKLTAIALEVGCSSLQHFSGLFRRETGLTPSAWRRQEQSGATL